MHIVPLFLATDLGNTGEWSEVTRPAWGVRLRRKDRGATPHTPERNAILPRCGREIPSGAVWAIALALLVLVLSACAPRFDRYNAGALEVWIGGQLMVQKECERRGVVLYSNDTKILGCADFVGRAIVSIPDPKVIAHEMCHWTLRTESHEVCPLPLVVGH